MSSKFYYSCGGINPYTPTVGLLDKDGPDHKTKPVARHPIRSVLVAGTQKQLGSQGSLVG
jgi:hypothetical protein